MVGFISSVRRSNVQILLCVAMKAVLACSLLGGNFARLATGSRSQCRHVHNKKPRTKQMEMEEIPRDCCRSTVDYAFHARTPIQCIKFARDPQYPMNVCTMQ